MINSTFNTSIKRDFSNTLVPPRFFFTETSFDGADVFLIPIHFLFNGRSVTLFQNNVIKEEALYTSKNWVKTAFVITVFAPPFILGLVVSPTAAILASIPIGFLSTMTIIGVALKAIALCSSEERKGRKAIANFYQDGNKFNQPMPLAVSQRVLDRKMATLRAKMTSYAVWENPAFIQEVDDYLKIAAMAMEQFFGDLEKLSNNAPEMAKWLSERKIKKEELASLKTQEMLRSENEEEKELLKDGKDLPTEEENPLTHHFFNNSFFDLYHHARRCCIFDKRGMKVKTLSEADQAIYFKEGTPQYQWRMTFNSLCKRFEQYIHTNTDGNQTKLSLRETLWDLSKSLYKPWENEKEWNRYLDQKNKPTPTDKDEMVLDDIEESETTEFNVKLFRKELKKVEESQNERLLVSRKNDISYCVWLWTTQDEKPLKGPSELFPSKPFLI